MPEDRLQPISGFHRAVVTYMKVTIDITAGLDRSLRVAMTQGGIGAFEKEQG